MFTYDSFRADQDTLKILIVTDTHLGFNEKDGVRGKDSYFAFEEALDYAKEKGVDMILHGGDLFHDNKPSRQCMLQTTNLLKHCVLGDQQVNIRVISDQSTDFRFVS